VEISLRRGLPSRAALARRIAKGLYQDWQRFTRLLGRRIPVWATRMISQQAQRMRWIIGKARTVWPVAEAHDRRSAGPSDASGTNSRARNAASGCFSVLAYGRPFRRAYRSTGSNRYRALHADGRNAFGLICATGLRIALRQRYRLHPLSSASGVPLGTCLWFRLLPSLWNSKRLKSISCCVNTASSSSSRIFQLKRDVPLSFMTFNSKTAASPFRGNAREAGECFYTGAVRRRCSQASCTLHPRANRSPAR